MVAEFEKSMVVGENGERAVKEILCHTYDFFAVPPDVDINGIDAKMVHRASGTGFTVQIKTDAKSVETGNIFVELVSVAGEGGGNLPSWGWKCAADVLLIHVPHASPGQAIAYFVDHVRLRAVIPFWLTKFGVKRVRNRDYGLRGYDTLGIAVPLAMFCCACVIGEVAGPSQ